jgi:hypothetical protein
MRNMPSVKLGGPHDEDGDSLSGRNRGQGGFRGSAPSRTPATPSWTLAISPMAREEPDRSYGKLSHCHGFTIAQ